MKTLTNIRSKLKLTKKGKLILLGLSIFYVFYASIIVMQDRSVISQSTESFLLLLSASIVGITNGYLTRSYTWLRTILTLLAVTLGAVITVLLAHLI